MTEYFTVKQVIKKMNLSRSTIMKLIKQGRLKTIRVDATGNGKGKYLITQEQIDECFGPKEEE